MGKKKKGKNDNAKYFITNLEKIQAIMKKRGIDYKIVIPS